MKWLNRWRSWKSMWEGQTTPRFGDDTEDFYQAFSRELRLLYGTTQPRRVLDIGCGNGALFEHMGFGLVSQYRGVDLSSTMISEFHRRQPSASLVVCSGEKYEDDQQYDMIFLMGVVQYFSIAMLEEHLVRAKKMLAPDGCIVWAAIPWRIAKHSYMRGELMGLQQAGWLRFLKASVRQFLGSYMGRWYDHREIFKMASKHGFHAKFFGSLKHPYRFHAVLKFDSALQSFQDSRRAA